MKVPKVSTRQNVGQVALQGVRRTAEDFGAGLAQPVAQAAKGVQELALKEFQAANIASVQDAESKLYEWENNALYGDNGLYKKKGKDAMGASDSLIADFDEYSSKLMAELTNDQQRDSFKRSLQNRRNDLNRSSTRYQFNELQSYKEEQSKSYIVNSQTAAANNYTDPIRVGEEIDRQVDSIRATANANGLSAEQTKLQVDSAVSSTHSKVLSRYLANKDYAGAKVYFERNKDFILPEKRDQLQSQVNTGDVRGRSQLEADRIISTGVSEKEALKEARAISDPEVRDQTVTRIKTRYSEQESQQKDFENQTFDSAANIVEQTGDATNVPPDMWEVLSLNQRSALEKRATQISVGEPATTDWKIWTTLNEMPDNEFVSVNLWQYRPNLSDAHYQQFSNEQQRIKALIAEGQRSPQLSSTMTFKDQTKQVAGDAGIIPVGKTPAKWSEDESLRYGLFQTQAAARIEAFEYEKGAKATGQERQQILDQMVIQSVKIKESWASDPELFLYEVTEDERGNAYVPFSDIPDGEVASAKNLIRSSGLSPTKDRIQRLYAAMLLNDRLLADQILEGN